MIPALLLILAAVAYRIVTGLAIISGSTWLSNFAPLAAIALCAAAYFPKRYKFTVPMIALLISDVVLNMHYGFSLLSPFVASHYLGFALVGGLGLLLQNRASLKTLLPASIAASVIFYVVTNICLLGLRSRVREELRRIDPGADGGSAGLQRHADLDVFPQLAPERSLLHAALRPLHECWAEPGTRAHRHGIVARCLIRPCRRRSNATKSKCSR